MTTKIITSNDKITAVLKAQGKADISFSAVMAVSPLPSF